MTNAPSSSADFIELEHRFAAPHYSPLDVVIARGEGAWVARRGSQVSDAHTARKGRQIIE